MFRIKICGVTTADDARAAINAGADAIGVNFYPKSKRFVDIETARQIADAVAGRAKTVGVFVNSAPEEIRSAVDAVGLSAAQLHGDEPPGTVEALAGIPVVSARRFEGSAEAIRRYLAECAAAGRSPDAVLVDAAATGHYGGSGSSLPWRDFANNAGRLGGLPLVLAGGLTPDNVAEAIATVGPHGVDVASGVESAPGRKDPEACQRFVANALAALRCLGPT